jgi:hypothetical protein
MRTVTPDRDDQHSRYYFARIKAGASVTDDPEQVAWDALMYAATHVEVGEAGEVFDGLHGIVTRCDREFGA